MTTARSASAFVLSPILHRNAAIAHSATSYSSISSILMSKKDQSFPTWSFDKPCTSIEWNALVPVELTATTEMTYEDSDLIIVGIYAPESADDESNDDAMDGAEPPPVNLTGKAKEIDDSLGGILSQVINDNAKTFKAGAKAGSMTPTVRVANPGGKVGPSSIALLLLRFWFAHGILTILVQTICCAWIGQTPQGRRQRDGQSWTRLGQSRCK